MSRVIGFTTTLGKYGLTDDEPKGVVTFSKTFTVEINVKYDPESNVYVATSSGTAGLIIEAETLKQLLEEVNELIYICLE